MKLSVLLRKLAHATCTDFHMLKNFRLKIIDIFNIFVQNIGFEYTLEPPLFPRALGGWGELGHYDEILSRLYPRELLIIPLLKSIRDII